MLFKVSGVCRLVRDIELRYLPTGAAVAKVGLATSTTYKGQDGQKHEKQCFIDAQVFGRAAEIWNQFLNKGSQIFVIGDLELHQWEDQNGQKRSKHVLNVREFEFVGSNVQTNNGQQPQQQQQQSDNQSNNGQASSSHDQVDIDDQYIPF